MGGFSQTVMLTLNWGHGFLMGMCKYQDLFLFSLVGSVFLERTLLTSAVNGFFFFLETSVDSGLSVSAFGV